MKERLKIFLVLAAFVAGLALGFSLVGSFDRFLTLRVLCAEASALALYLVIRQQIYHASPFDTAVNWLKAALPATVYVIGGSFIAGLYCVLSLVGSLTMLRALRTFLFHGLGGFSHTELGLAIAMPIVLSTVVGVGVLLCLIGHLLVKGTVALFANRKQ
jgi:uncharacterized membrane protein YqgA involved in biofilm formation